MVASMAVYWVVQMVVRLADLKVAKMVEPKAD